MNHFYGLGKGFPGGALPSNLSSTQKAERIEAAILTDIRNEMRDDFYPLRFLPYIQMHEFEGLLFSDTKRMAEGMQRPDLARVFQKIRSSFPTPEDINDGPDTAPSKRVRAHIIYDKILDGNLAAKSVGLEAMLGQCPHFSEWWSRLLALCESEEK